MTEMNTAWTAASEEIYKAQSSSGWRATVSTDTGGARAQAINETVTDAEFEEVNNIPDYADFYMI